MPRCLNSPGNLGLSLREEPLEPSRIETASEGLLSNAVIGLRPVGVIDGIRFAAPGPVTAALGAAFGAPGSPMKPVRPASLSRVCSGVEDTALREQVSFSYPLSKSGLFRRIHSRTMVACSISSRMLCRRNSLSAGSSQSSARWRYQSAGLDLFHQRDGGLVHREGGLAQTFAGRVKVFRSTMGVALLPGCGGRAGTARPVDRP